MKVLVYASVFQADILSLTLSLDQDPDIDVLVVTKFKRGYLDEPIARALPLSCPIFDRDEDSFLKVARKFDADVVVTDNHVPKKKLGKRLLYCWHGIGWRDRPRSDLRQFYKAVGRLVGKVSVPNPAFVAQCYGSWDYEHRVKSWGLPQENCHIFGSSYADLLLNPPYSRKSLEDFYGLDLTTRSTLLISLTWAFGRYFGPDWDDEVEILRKLLGVAQDSGLNVIFSLHDRMRYFPDVLKTLYETVRPYGNVVIKHRDEHSDNLADIVASDIMISNFSSFISFFYFTGNPSIHILPSRFEGTKGRFSKLSRGRVVSVREDMNNVLWQNPSLEDNGGLLVRNEAELMSALDRALREPDCCREKSWDFLKHKVQYLDGRSRERMVAYMKEWVAKG